MQIAKTTKTDKWEVRPVKTVSEDTFTKAVSNLDFDLTKLRERTDATFEQLSELKGQMVERRCEILLQRRRFQYEIERMQKTMRRQDIASFLLSLVLCLGLVVQIVAYFS